jgi:hypothetical protein
MLPYLLTAVRVELCVVMMMMVGYRGIGGHRGYPLSFFPPLPRGHSS